MKKFFFFLIIGIVFAGSYFFVESNFLRSKVRSIKRSDHPLPTDSLKLKKEEEATRKNKISKIIQRSIFVPYWSLTTFHPPGGMAKKDEKYDRYIYFGITANSQGIDERETRSLRLDKFVEATEDKTRLVALRLLNDDFNKNLLKNEDLQKKIIDQTVALVNEKNFAGVVLDLELFSLFDADISLQINQFVKRFYTALKSDYKTLALTIYGDSFFRKRPFDIKILSEFSDEIMVMAYDFHKAKGEPGPNFPFEKGGVYNYDFKMMIDDFLTFVEPQKLTVVFGMYGYDWRVDEKRRPIIQAKALTLKQIKEKFYSGGDGNENKIGCQIENCLIKRDETSKEMEIDYVILSDAPDEEGIYRLDYHIIWFEDQESVKIKTNYLKEKGIDSFAYWAYSYF